MITKKGDGSQVKESTDSSTTLEDDEIKGEWINFIFFIKNDPFFIKGFKSTTPPNQSKKIFLNF